MMHKELDLNRVCRTCKNECPEMYSLFSRISEIGKEDLRINEMLMACASVQVSCEDELPKSMCLTCIKQLTNAFNFKALCESTDASLRQYVKNVKNNCQVKIEETIIQKLYNGQDSSHAFSIKDEDGCIKDENDSSPSSCEENSENSTTLLTCDVCLGIFTTLNGLQCHKCMALFKCKQCGKEYKSLNCLEEHELSHSRRGKVCFCKICKTALTTHGHSYSVLHLKEAPSGCQTWNQDNCMNQFNDDGNHVCDVCNVENPCLPHNGAPSNGNVLEYDLPSTSESTFSNSTERAPLCFEPINAQGSPDLINCNPVIDLCAELEGVFLKDLPPRQEKEKEIAINKYKETICKFCDGAIVSQHYSRHLKRNHGAEKEVKHAFSATTNAAERKRLLSIMRNDGNLDRAIRGCIIPKRRDRKRIPNETEYAICMYCKGYYKRPCLSRHVKKCSSKDRDKASRRPLTDSLIFNACQKKIGEILDKLPVTNEIFQKMQGDEITSVAVNDILIVFLGDDLLKKTKHKQRLYSISNRLRECARFLLEMKKMGNYTDIISTLKPQNFDDVVEATKRMSKFNALTKTFGSPSLALRFGTTLKALADLAESLILRNEIPLDVYNAEQTLITLNSFQKLVESRWATEIGSWVRELGASGIIAKPGTRGKWKQNQKNIMLKYFKQNIAMKKALKKKECEEFLCKFKHEFEDVSWLRIKTFIFNSYR